MLTHVLSCLVCVCASPPGVRPECYTANGEDYRGVQNRTAGTGSGKACLYWNETFQHPYNTVKYPNGEGGLGPHNFCRWVRLGGVRGVGAGRGDGAAGGGVGARLGFYCCEAIGRTEVFCFERSGRTATKKEVRNSANGAFFVEGIFSFSILANFSTPPVHWGLWLFPRPLRCCLQLF